MTSSILILDFICSSVSLVCFTKRKNKAVGKVMLLSTEWRMVHKVLSCGKKEKYFVHSNFVKFMTLFLSLIIWIADFFFSFSDLGTKWTTALIFSGYKDGSLLEKNKIFVSQSASLIPTLLNFPETKGGKMCVLWKRSDIWYHILFHRMPSGYKNEYTFL